MDQKPDFRPDRHSPDEGPPPGRGPSFFNPRTLLIWGLLFAVVLLLASLFNDGLSGAKSEKTYTEFLADLDRQPQSPIEKVVVQEDDMVVTLRKESVAEGKGPTEYHVKLNAEWVGPTEERIREHNEKIAALKAAGKEAPPPVVLSSNPPNMWLRTFLLYVLPFALPVLLLLYLFRQMRGPGGSGVLAFGKSRARLMKKSTGVTFDDVAGIEESKEDVLEVIEFLRNPERFERLGGRVPRGILLIGPPGTGKTLLAKAIAGEADRPFFSISGSDFVEMFVGVGASRVRDLFRQAKENSPCIIFLDEIDAVGRRRGTGLGGGHDEREQTLNAILVEMDGFETDDRVILIAATNRPDVLDPALLRPGRFDRQVVVDLPDVRGREAILKVKTRHVKLADDADLKVIARGTSMCSGAELENIVNEAAILAALKDRDEVTTEDLEEARDKVLWGRAKRSKVVAEYERRIAAFHEAGHAISAALLEHCDPLHKVTIIPRGAAAGMTMTLPKEDTRLLPRKKLLDQVTMALAGRAAEELFCDDITSGAQSDFEAVTETARMMVCRWGMTDTLGPVCYAEREEHLFLGREVTRVRTLSEATALKIDTAIRNIVDACEERCRRLLDQNRDKVERVATALLEHEVLDADDVARLMDGQPIARRRPEPGVSEPQADKDHPTDNQ